MDFALLVCSAAQARLTVTAPDRAGGRVIVQIAHLRAHGLDAHRRLEAEAVEHKPRLIGDMPQTRGNKFPIAQRVSQRGISHGGNNGIGIGIAVAGDIDGFHEKPPYARGKLDPLMMQNEADGIIAVQIVPAIPFIGCIRQVHQLRRLRAEEL